MLKLYVFILFLPLVCIAKKSDETDSVFRFYLRSEPLSFNPAEFSWNETSYFFSQIFRGLYRYDDKKGLIPEGAKKCEFVNPLKLVCNLNPNFRFSDGTNITANHYVKSFSNLLNPQAKTRDNSLLENLKNAKKIILGEMTLETLGIKALSDFVLEFEFEKPDLEFIFKLSSPQLSVWKTLPDIKNVTSLITSGPYAIEKYETGKKAILSPNTHYPHGNPKRPSVEILFLEDDITVQNLFDTQRIDFISRMDLTSYKKYQNKKGFFKKEFSRFDYLGFGEELQKADINLRKAMVLSLDYSEITKIFSTGRFGCVGLSKNLIQNRRCYEFNPKLAKSLFDNLPQNLKEKTWTLKYSMAGGDNVTRTMEWYQNQWKKNLGLKVSLEAVEQGMYLQTLKNNTPDIFRKGINLDRPTCAAALESFHSENFDNYIKFQSKIFDAFFENKAFLSNNKTECEKAISILLDNYRIIPQGVVTYAMLSNNKFEGIEFNEYNQLNLSNLRRK